MSTSRQRIIDAGMRMFGERGYAATSVAQIEEAAGLSPGAGGLYAHFRSKEALLREGLESILTPAPDLATGPPQADPDGSSKPDPGKQRPLPRDQLTALLDDVVRAGLDRLDHDRDFNRILIRDLRTNPELLELAANRELRPVHDQVAALIGSLAASEDNHLDHQAVAAVLVGATSHFWIMTDVFGKHPANVTKDRYIAALVQLTVALLDPDGSPRTSRMDE